MMESLENSIQKGKGYTIIRADTPVGPYSSSGSLGFKGPPLTRSRNSLPTLKAGNFLGFT
jgi:hypothetical protein